MFYAPAFLMISLIGTIGAREPDIDINRISPMLNPTFHLVNKPYKYHEAYHFSKRNDYDDTSSWKRILHSREQLLHDRTKSITKDTKPPITVHLPREDPRFFYQSDSYLKEINDENLNRDATFIYPGKEVIRADQDYIHSLPLRDKRREQNLIPNGNNFCVRCPHDRTLVAKPGSDRVMLQPPRLFSCSGHRAMRNARFVHMYGPKFGSLIDQGTYMIIGSITMKNKSLHLCKMQIHVVVQGCTTPTELIAHCGDEHKPCNFTCRDQKFDLYGPTALECGKNLKWNGDLPVCKVRTWCEIPPPPENGEVSCKGATAGSALRLAEGAKCRVRCARGWRGRTSVCRRGAWTHTLECLPKRSYN